MANNDKQVSIFIINEDIHNETNSNHIILVALDKSEMFNAEGS